MTKKTFAPVRATRAKFLPLVDAPRKIQSNFKPRSKTRLAAKFGHKIALRIFAKNLIDFAVSPHNSKLLAFPAPFDARKGAKEFRINGHSVQAFFWTFGKNSR